MTDARTKAPSAKWHMLPIYFKAAFWNTVATETDIIETHYQLCLQLRQVIRILFCL